MPDIDLSSKIPPKARWIKLRFKMTPKKPGANLTARLWSGDLKDAVVINGEEGDVFVQLDRPQKLSFQSPVNIDLDLKVVGYKEEGEEA